MTEICCCPDPNDPEEERAHFARWDYKCPACPVCFPGDYEYEQHSFDAVTRVELIDSGGRRFVGYCEPGVVVLVQDEGRTLKVFAGEYLTYEQWKAEHRDV